ncbi:surfactin biosynthesis thioesterase SrfAD [Bacillus atrophaeus]|uniref:surfactin biosynthesis thioesterase SrfAD n=1 Tax=Bacillus atrophaeus TaxID=1452 RepID=UPI00227DBCDE|nr:surfactin biosynthesis thioesterase SrfAD [Bacillus atrophaeus]MCY8809883.1 surfactin biosynthesis thioesterase SrfAD [Bacillus atrophaeus]
MSQLFRSFDTSEKTQLICFPFAGGYSASFRPLHAYLQGECEMLAAEPPGHGTNQTSAIEDLEELVRLYKQELNLRPDRPFVLFGHSMGGMIAFRLAQKLEREGIFPQAVIISAIQPPNVKRKKVSHLEDEAFLEHIMELGGMPAELAENKEVMTFFLPSFRSDYRALERFEPRDLGQLQSPVHIFNGRKDEKCMRDARGWDQWAQNPAYHEFDGGHMFLLSETEKVAEEIFSILNHCKPAVFHK